MAWGVRMSIKGIYVTPKRLASGIVRYYYYTRRRGTQFWTSDSKRIDEPGKRLPADFIAAYQAACESETGPSSGSFSEAISVYRSKSIKFRQMKPKGRIAREKYLSAWEKMPMHEGRLAGGAPLSVFDSRKIIKFITAYRDEVWGHSASTADEAVIALSAFLTWCQRDGRLDWNRSKGIEQVYERPTDARIWSKNEQSKFLESASQHLRWAFLLLLHTGLRREDLTRLPVSAIRREHILIPTGKSGGKRTALVPITPPLRTLLEELNSARENLTTQPTTILISSRGTPWTAEGLGTSFDRQRTKVGLGPDNNGPTIHDMRKTCATYMVILQHKYPELISDQILLDWFGWSQNTLAKMKRIYVSDAAVIEAMTEAI